jgi:hypothetical protein
VILAIAVAFQGAVGRAALAVSMCERLPKLLILVAQFCDSLMR